MDPARARTILLVEDEAIIALAQAAALRSFGYKVIHVLTGESAVRVASGERDIGLVLMDIDLGAGIDGPGAARLILESRALPIVFLTSHSEDAMVEKVRGVTRYGYVVKNSGDFVLRSSIEMAFELFEAHRRTAESEERHSLINDSSEDIIYSYDRQGRFTSVNRAFCEAMGLRPGEILGRTHAELGFPEAQCREWEGLHRRVYESGRRVTEVSSVVMPGAGLQHFEVILNPLHDPSGAVSGIGGTSRNITTRVLAEGELRKKNEDLRMISDFSLGLASLPPEGDLRRHILKRLMEYSGAELAVLSDYDREKRALVVSRIESRKAIIDIAVRLGGKRILETESPVPPDMYELMLRTVVTTSSTLGEVTFGAIPDRVDRALRRATGLSRFCGIAFVDSAASTLFGTAMLGFTEGVSAPERDFLESLAHLATISLRRRKAEEALRQSEERYRTVVSAASEGIVLQDASGRIETWNPAAERIFGIPSGEIVGKAATDREWRTSREDGTVLRGADHPSMRTLATGEPCRDALMRVTRPDSGYSWININTMPIFQKDAKSPSQVVITFSDITGRRRADERIRTLLMEKELLLKEVHHRIKNNMNTMSSLLYLRSTMLEDESAKSALLDAETRLKSMGVLYDKLYRSDDFQGMSLKLYLPPLLEEIAAVFPNRSTVRIVARIDDVELDSRMLANLGIIVNELFTNAMKYAFDPAKGGTVRVSARHAGNRLTLTLADNGKGLPVSPDPLHSGGFGFQLVDMLVRQLDGRIRIERGRGSAFIMEFDIPPAPPAQSPA